MKPLNEIGTPLDRLAWGALAAGSAIVAAGLVRKLARSGWREATGDDPPRNPASPDVPWRDAIAWSVGTGVGVGVARLFARRLAASGWRRATGSLPPV